MKFPCLMKKIAAPFVRAAKGKENRKKEEKAVKEKEEQIIQEKPRSEENQRKEESAVKEIARGDKFTELTLGYRHVHHEIYI